MELRAGYKQTEAGVIPEDWDTQDMLGIARQIMDYRGRTPKKLGMDWGGGDIPALSAGNVKKGFVDLNQECYFGSEALYSKWMTRGDMARGDILFTTEAPLGNVALVPDDRKYILSQRTVLIQVDQTRVSSRFLYQMMLSDSFQRMLADYSSGSTAKGIKRKKFEQLCIALPQLPEQNAIAAALSDVDELLGALDKLIAKKQSLKIAAMQQLLTGQTRIPGFSGAWAVKRLGDTGKCLRGVSYKGDSDLSAHDTASTKRLLRSNNVQSAIVVTDEVQFVNTARVSMHQILKKDDILICMANGSKALVGKAGVFNVSNGYEYTFGAFMGCFRADDTVANPTFVFYLFQTARYRDYINNLLAGSSINNLRPSSVESLEFDMPPVPEQTAIAAVLVDMDTELAALQARRSKTKALKQAMMQELLTGRTRLI